MPAGYKIVTPKVRTERQKRFVPKESEKRGSKAGDAYLPNNPPSRTISLSSKLNTEDELYVDDRSVENYHKHNE